jgi:hypothetical protein
VILTSSECEWFEFVATLLSAADGAVNQLKVELIEGTRGTVTTGGVECIG